MEILEAENLGKPTENTIASIINRLQVMEERISAIDNTVNEIDISEWEGVKSKKFLTQNIQEIREGLWEGQT